MRLPHHICPSFDYTAFRSGWHIRFAMTCCFCAYYLAAYPPSTICTNHSCLIAKWFFVCLSTPSLNIRSCGDSWDTSCSAAIWLDNSLWDLTSSIAIGISRYDFSNLSNTASAAWQTLQVSECLYIIPQPDAQVVIYSCILVRSSAFLIIVFVLQT